MHVYEQVSGRLTVWLIGSVTYRINSKKSFFNGAFNLTSCAKGPTGVLAEPEAYLFLLYHIEKGLEEMEC